MKRTKTSIYLSSVFTRAPYAAAKDQAAFHIRKSNYAEYANFQCEQSRNTRLLARIHGWHAAALPLLRNSCVRNKKLHHAYIYIPNTLMAKTRYTPGAEQSTTCTCARLICYRCARKSKGESEGNSPERARERESLCPLGSIRQRARITPINPASRLPRNPFFWRGSLLRKQTGVRAREGRAQHQSIQLLLWEVSRMPVAAVECAVTTSRFSSREVSESDDESLAPIPRGFASTS